MKGKILFLVLFLVIVTVFSACIGGYKFENFPHFTNSEYFILKQIRLPRILCVMIAGFGLAVCGAAVQALLKNPLAESSVIGISSGCAVFASLGIVLFGESSVVFYMVPLMSFIGGVITTLIVLMIGIKARVVYAIILAGVAINAICGGIISLILFLSNSDAMRSINFWMMGSFTSASWQQFIVLLLITLCVFIILYKNARNLDILALGEEDAKMLGVNVRKLRIVVILAVCLCVGACVAFFGMIGFIGLVTAHIVRLLFGSSNRVVFAISPFIGALILLISDDIARTIVLPSELPIGIITSIIGGPFFMYLIMRKNVGM